MKSNLDCNWNQRGDKFCIGSGSGNVYLGTFFAENNFWVAHPLKKKALHKSSVVCVRFDPLSGRVIASASLDGTVQITSAYKEELDTDSAGPFGQVTSYGETLLSVSSNGWINHLAFSPSSSTLCYLTHDCELNFADLSEVAKTSGKSKVQSEKVLHTGNPHFNCVFIQEDKLIACGYDKVPYLYQKQGAEWKMIKCLDDGINKVRKAKITGNSFLDKKVYFNSDFKLGTNVEMKETDTKHLNYINYMRVFARDDKKVLLLTTSDRNGCLNYWDVSSY